MFDYQTEPQLVTKLLLHVYIRKLHNSLVSDPNDGGIKDTRDEDDKLLSVILHCIHCYHLNKHKCLQYTKSCVVVNVAFMLRVYIHNYYPGVIGI